MLPSALTKNGQKERQQTTSSMSSATTTTQTENGDAFFRRAKTH